MSKERTELGKQKSCAFNPCSDNHLVPIFAAKINHCTDGRLDSNAAVDKAAVFIRILMANKKHNNVRAIRRKWRHEM